MKIVAIDSLIICLYLQGHKSGELRPVSNEKTFFIKNNH